MKSQKLLPALIIFFLLSTISFYQNCAKKVQDNQSSELGSTKVELNSYGLNETDLENRAENKAVNGSPLVTLSLLMSDQKYSVNNLVNSLKQNNFILVYSSNKKPVKGYIQIGSDFSAYSYTCVDCGKSNRFVRVELCTIVDAGKNPKLIPNKIVVGKNMCARQAPRNAYAMLANQFVYLDTSGPAYSGVYQALKFASAPIIGVKDYEQYKDFLESAPIGYSPDIEGGGTSPRVDPLNEVKKTLYGDYGCTLNDTNSAKFNDANQIFSCGKIRVIPPYAVAANKLAGPSESYLPGCAGKIGYKENERNACWHQGSIKDETYAIRFDFKGFSDDASHSSYSVLTPNDLMAVANGTIFPGQDPFDTEHSRYQHWHIAISKIPGDFNPKDAKCKDQATWISPSIRIAQKGAKAWQPGYPSASQYELDQSCQLEKGVRYYINIKPDKANCGIPPNYPNAACRITVSVNTPL